MEIDHRTNDGLTPLILSVKNNHNYVSSYLMAEGANVTLTS